MMLRRTLLAFTVAVPAVLLAPAESLCAGDAPQEPDPRWLDRLDAADRALLQEWVGYAPPQFPAQVTFVSGQPLSWDELRGKVLVLQSWSNRRSDGRGATTHVMRLAEEYEDADLRVLLLHTPEGADRLQKYLERRQVEAPVVLDSRGVYCDTLGIYKEPVNLVIDRQGAVRYVGLNRRGLPEAVDRLVKEPFDPGRVAPQRPEAEQEEVDYPPLNTGRISAKKNLQGQKAPAFYVQSWVNQAPETPEKVMLIDFWATWCAPCRRSVGHLNELAERFREDLNVIAVSDESLGAFQQGFRQHARELRLDAIRYHLALDPSRRMKGAIGVTGIPHCVVISRDGIVRWQGHPAQLDASTLEQIIAADRGGVSAEGDRWARETS